MTVTRWDPVRDLLGLQNRINQALVESNAQWGTDDQYGAWVPPVDIYERGDDLVISAELAGVPREQVDVRIEENTLILHGERKRKTEVNEQKAYRLERNFGAFTRRFGLPTTIDPTRISAKFVDGVLEVTLPKADAAKPRRIEVSVS